MAKHTASSRRRIAAGLAAPAVLGVAALVAVAVSVTDTPKTTTDTTLVSSTTDCHDMVSIAIGGRGDSPRADKNVMLEDRDHQILPAALSGDYSSHWVDPVVNAPTDAGKDYAAFYVEYPASLASYEDAVTAGVDNTKTVMQAIRAECPNTQFAIVGYSEGADVARRAAMEIGNQTPNDDGSYPIIDPNTVVGVVILSDAGRTAGQAPFPGAENPYSNPDGYDRAYQSGNTSADGSGVLPNTAGGFGALDGKIASFCSEGDFTCDAPENISLVNLAANVGRQLNADKLQDEGLTVATGQDLAVTIGRIAMLAFDDIESQGNWMQSDETFLDVLLKVSDPSYTPTAPTDIAAGTDADQVVKLSAAENLVYLPAKVRNEIIGFIATNANTIPVVLSDPYQQTFGEVTGHHFDYWHDADAANGKSTSSAQYAADWLTQLADQADKGTLPRATTKSTTAELRAVTEETTSATATSTPAPSSTGAATTGTTSTGETAATDTTTSTGTLDAAVAPAPAADAAAAVVTDPAASTPAATPQTATDTPATATPATPATASTPATAAPTSTTTVAPTTTTPVPPQQR